MSNVTAAQPQAEQAQAEPVAWMNPETLDVIHDTRKRAWENDFGMGGKAKADGYTYRLVAPAQAEQVEAVRAAYENAAQICDQQALEPECPERAEYCAEAIRALAKEAAPSTEQATQGGDRG